MYAEITAAVASAKTLTELLSGARSLANYSELTAQAADLNKKLLDALLGSLAVTEKLTASESRNRVLEEELAQVKHWESEIERYELHALAAGVLAYAVKPGMEAGEPTHYLWRPVCSDGKRRRTPRYVN